MGDEIDKYNEEVERYNAQVDQDNADPIFGQGRSAAHLSENWRAAVVAAIVLTACFVIAILVGLFK